MRWSRTLLVLPFAVVLAAGCSSQSDVVEPPSEVVEQWLASIDANEFESATDNTYEPAMAIVIGLENGLSAAETAALLTSGIPTSVSVAYWSSFQGGFDAFAGYPLSALGVGSSEEIFAEGVQFAAVAVTDPSDGNGVIFTRDDPARLVDLVATLAPGFVEALLRTYEALPSDPDGDVVKAVFEDTVVPAMWAAISSGQYDDEFTRRAMALIDAVTTSTLPSP